MMPEGVGRKDQTMPTITRRDLIVGTTGAVTVAVGFPLAAGAQETITVDEFRALSARLTGVDAATRSNSCQQAARRLHLDGTGTRSRCACCRSWAQHRTARGRHRRGLVFRPLRHRRRSGHVRPNQALLWKALDFTKPPGVCGGETGYWADAPTS